ncbi:unnamed protein product [Owenia fusiformis]|uniref:Uncharacterized protein n=1 Tax=Owenia fusiformis TaxID=6347 RepID=A0A8J1XTZ6_OWEFU|nr:unnamed protein product [Owenia fusiformis]
MTTKLMTAALLVVLPSICLGFHLDDIFGKPPATVDRVEIPKYLGRWYQVYYNSNLRNSFLRNAVCITADYGAINATTISVLNSNRIMTPNGPLDQIAGFGYKTDTEGQLLVELSGVPLPAPYWILKLGPVLNGQYQYSIVSDPIRFTLFVLARDPQDFAERYDREVLSYLEGEQFTDVGNRPERVYSGRDCLFANVPPQ